jgi:AbrB family looped-hinge helix DNA binding protein
MDVVTVSSKFQIVIPRSVRKALNIQPGQKLQVLTYNGSIHLVPVVPIEHLRGFLKGIDTDIPREREDRV